MHPAILAGLIAFAVAVLMGPGTIRYLRRLRYGQQVRDDGPKSHLTKQGTPTMGGVIIVTALLVGVLLVAPKSDILLYALFTIGGYALVGAMDDMLKIVGRRSLGLKARHKLVGQILIAGPVPVRPVGQRDGAALALCGGSLAGASAAVPDI